MSEEENGADRETMTEPDKYSEKLMYSQVTLYYRRKRERERKEKERKAVEKP